MNTTKQFILKSRPDRFGSVFLSFLSQIAFAHYNKLYIDYGAIQFDNEHQKDYEHSIFILAMKRYIDVYNADKIKNGVFENTICDNEFYNDDLCGLFSKTVIAIKSDAISYFRKHIQKTMYSHLNELAYLKNYSVPFDPENTILIHLRLEDVAARMDYDGRVCANLYAEHLNNDMWHQYEDFHGVYNRQAPIKISKIEHIVNTIKEKKKMLENKEYEVLVITSPTPALRIPYRSIQSDDLNYDLFLLTQCDTLILSRSMFSISSAFLGRAKEVYIPIWGHVASMGLTSKYDQNENHFYFY